MTQQQNPIRRRADGSIDTNHYARLSMALRRQAVAEARTGWPNALRAWLCSWTGLSRSTRRDAQA